MSDIRKKHRVIGIRHTLKQIREAGLIPDGIIYPSDAVNELKRTHIKANTAKRYRCARSDSSIRTVIERI